jgi:hypothetical protein
MFSASPARPSSSRILRLLVNSNPSSAAATNSVINLPIFKQCIISRTDNNIPYGISDFVAPQSSIFSANYANETMFRKAVFEERINPWLVNAQVSVWNN